MMKQRADANGMLVPVLARRSLRSAARHFLRPVGEREGESGAAFDTYGKELHVLASVLTTDTELAEQLVVQAIVAHQGGPCTLRELSAAVHVAWLAWGPPIWSVELPPAPSTSTSAAMLYEMHGLPDDQRAALGICRFGGHTYRQAADLFGVPAEDVARMLCEALRALATPRKRSAQPCPAA